MKLKVFVLSLLSLSFVACHAAEVAYGKQKADVTDVTMDDASEISAADLQIVKNSSGYTGEVLQEFHCWPDLPGDLKRRIMSYVTYASEVHAHTLQRISIASRVLHGHNDWVRSVVVDGDRIVSGSVDKTVLLWDKYTGNQLNVLRGHSGLVRSVVVDGDRIVSGSDDKTVRLWDKDTGNQLNVLHGHNGWVRSVAVDGECIVSGSYDKTVRLWDCTLFNVVDRWLREGCEPTRETIRFTNSSGKACEISVDPAELYMFLVECNAALQGNKKIQLSKKQCAYWDVLPSEVQTVLT